MYRQLSRDSGPFRYHQIVWMEKHASERERERCYVILGKRVKRGREHVRTTQGWKFSRGEAAQGKKRNIVPWAVCCYTDTSALQILPDRTSLFLCQNHQTEDNSPGLHLRPQHPAFTSLQSQLCLCWPVTMTLTDVFEHASCDIVVHADGKISRSGVEFREKETVSLPQGSAGRAGNKREKETFLDFWKNPCLCIIPS